MPFARFSNLVTPAKKVPAAPIFSDDDIRALFGHDFKGNGAADFLPIQIKGGLQSPLHAKRLIRKAINTGTDIKICSRRG
jgi:hypothetical protein